MHLYTSHYKHRLMVLSSCKLNLIYYLCLVAGRKEEFTKEGNDTSTIRKETDEEENSCQ